MIRLIPAIIIMLYYWLFQIKSYGKLFIYSTIQKPDYRHLSPTGLAAATRLPPFDGRGGAGARVTLMHYFNIAEKIQPTV
jgi:hypothetical protein